MERKKKEKKKKMIMMMKKKMKKKEKIVLTSHVAAVVVVVVVVLGCLYISTRVSLCGEEGVEIYVCEWIVRWKRDERKKSAARESTNTYPF